MSVATTIGTIAAVTATVIGATVTFMKCMDELEENNTWKGMKTNYAKIVKEIANRAQISKTVTPHILRHTLSYSRDI